MADYMERISRLKDRLLTVKPEMDLENARILTEGFIEYENMPLILKKAYAFRKQCREKTIFIADDELIVGNSGSKIRGGILCADCCWSVLDDELETMSERKYDPFHLREDDKEMFLDTVKPYWRGRSNYEQWRRQIPEDLRLLRDNGVVFIDRKGVRGFGETTAGYSWLLNVGLKGIRQTIDERRSRLDLAVPGDLEKDNFLQALLLVCEGIATMANRYAGLAEEMAAEEKNIVRKAELLQIADVCRKVPENPAATFHEALQSFYFYHTSIFMEQNAASYNPGRMDQYLLPFYRGDIEAERINQNQAQELLDCLWVKFSEPCLFQDAETAEYAAGYPMFQNVSVGGVDEAGRDAVNELSYLILQASIDVQLYQPSLSVRYNMAKNPNSFLRKVVELVSLGTGFPAFHNDEVGIRMMLNKGVPLKEAWDWNPCGCVETNLSGRMRQYTALADVNLGSIVELTLNDGVSRKSGDKISVSTGDPAEFESFDDFMKALKDHLSHTIHATVVGSHLLDEICLERPVPALSLTFKECIENGTDYSAGGAKYNVGNGIIMIGVADLVNSIASVQKLVYEDKTVSMQELCNALAADFQGYEHVQELCLDVPMYGNDIEEVDDIAAEIFTFIADEIEQYESKFGRMTPGILPVSGNTPFGLEVGALPSGRRAWKPLADGVSPSGGTDMGGPTAVLKSVSHIPHDRFNQGTLLNMKVEDELLNSEKGIQQMMALLKSMCSLGVFHVQFNVIDQEKLLKAQKNPEQYKGLLIRVAGYTAYFVELGKDVQDEIIARTVQKQII